MWRIIFLAVLVWVVIALVKRVIKASEIYAEKSDAINQAETASKDIVKCEQCDVHVLKSEAFSVSGRYYCSKVHLPDSTSN